MGESQLQKDDLHELLGGSRGPIDRYREFFVGRPGLAALARYELAQMLAVSTPGALGYVLRKALLGGLFNSVGSGVNFGRGLAIRHPHKISIGDRTAIDDLCLLDARGVKPGEFDIGSDVIVARGTMMSAKTDRGFISIGDHTTIGNACLLASTGGVRLGNWVGVGGQCYLGGGLYRTDDLEIPMLKQELYTKGPVVIGDDCWLGAGVTVLDGVEIGAGSIIGAGVVVREDVPPQTLVMPRGGSVMMPRSRGDRSDDPEGAEHSAPPSRQPVDPPPGGRPASAHDGILACVFKAMGVVNQTLPEEKRLDPAPGTALIGSGVLDSLGLVNLVVETEMALEEELGLSVDLSSGALGGDPGRLETAASLAAFIESLVAR